MRDRQSTDRDWDDAAPTAGTGCAAARPGLREGAVFEDDSPASLFGQFEDSRVTTVARELEAKLEGVLVKAAG